MTRPYVIGVDPGGHWTGVVARKGHAFLGGELVTNADEHLVGQDYLDEVCSAIRARFDLGQSHVVLAVEGLTHPSPHMGLANVQGLLDTAQVLGAIRCAAGVWLAEGLIDDLVIVPPGGHGSGPLGSYPAELVGEREQKGMGRLRHARSAWDVCGAAMVMRGPVVVAALS